MTSDFGLNKKNLNLIISSLQSYPEIEQAIIFGSRALGNYKAGSDIDIALKGEISQKLLAKIKTKLEEEISTPYLYDVVVYNNLDNENLITHIDQFGKTLF